MMFEFDSSTVPWMISMAKPANRLADFPLGKERLQLPMIRFFICEKFRTEERTSRSALEPPLETRRN